MYANISHILSHKRVPQVACVVLGCLIFFELAIGFFYDFNPSSPSKPTIESIPPSEETSLTALNKPFFGVYIPARIDSGDIKQSYANLTLVGILFSSDEKQSQAIIRLENAVEQIFHMGDKLAGGITIKRITPEGVLFERHNALERLTLPKNELLFEPLAKPLEE